MHENRSPGDTAIDTAAWSDLLHARGLRVTAGRLAALAYLHDHPHSSVSQVHEALLSAHPSLSYQSVNNIAHDLSECGILRRIDPPDSDSALFETRVGDNHHHVQCIVCRRIEDIDCLIGSAPCLTPNHDHGMRLLEASVTFRGICPECESKQEQEKGIGID